MQSDDETCHSDRPLWTIGRGTTALPAPPEAPSLVLCDYCAKSLQCSGKKEAAFCSLIILRVSLCVVFICKNYQMTTDQKMKAVKMGITTIYIHWFLHSLTKSD